MLFRHISFTFAAFGTIVTAQIPNSFAETRAEMPKAQDRAVQLTPEMRADILMARKMFREAVDMYKEAPQDSAVVLNKIGIAYHQLVELNVAKKYYEKASKVRPDYPEAINNLGTVFYAQKSYRKAITYYKRALQYSPNSASIHSNLGTAFFARKNYDLAFESYQTAMKLDPEVFENRSSHGVLLQERSVDERAKFHFYLAKTYAKAGNTERALLYLRKALEEGFKEKKRLIEEPDFALLQNNDEFKLLLATEHKVL